MASHLPSLLTLARIACASGVALVILGCFPGSATSSTRPAHTDLFNPAAHIDEGQVIVWN